MLQQVPTQILTLTDKNGKNIDIELDKGATVNYITMNEQIAHNFTIVPYNQISYLGDGDTMIKAYCEIRTILYRDKISLTLED